MQARLPSTHLVCKGPPEAALHILHAIAGTHAGLRRGTPRSTTELVVSRDSLCSLEHPSPRYTLLSPLGECAQRLASMISAPVTHAGMQETPSLLPSRWTTGTPGLRCTLRQAAAGRSSHWQALDTERLPVWEHWGEACRMGSCVAGAQRC